jgi:hypothetical protein
LFVHFECSFQALILNRTGVYIASKIALCKRKIINFCAYLNRSERRLPTEIKSAFWDIRGDVPGSQCPSSNRQAKVSSLRTTAWAARHQRDPLFELG